MSHYVISDIHGEADRFHAMLEKIRFSEADTLYILGDVVDRGPGGIRLLREIMAAPNMVLLLGNHEHMMMRYYSPNVTEVEIRRWDKNRNLATKVGFLELNPEQQQELTEFIRTRQSHLEVTVNDRDFYLVHGFPGGNVHDEVWFRPELDTPNPIPGSTVIIGHTPVQYILKPDDDERHVWLDDLAIRGEHLRILHAPGFIDIDCSCGYNLACRTLACIRLEDMAEFYT